MSDHTDYEVWRAGPNPKARDVRLYFGLDAEGAQATLALCNEDKAEGYPDAPVEFYVMRVTRERVTEEKPETWVEWGVLRTWGPCAGEVSRMDRHTAEHCARDWPGVLASRTVTAGPWTTEESTEGRDDEEMARLAQAWDEGAAYVRKNPREHAYAHNPYRTKG